MAEINALAIINHYNSLGRTEKVDLRTKILDATGMAMATFYSKMSQAFPFTKSEVIVINSLINEENHADKD